MNDWVNDLTDAVQPSERDTAGRSAVRIGQLLIDWMIDWLTSTVWPSEWDTDSG